VCICIKELYNDGTEVALMHVNKIIMKVLACIFLLFASVELMAYDSGIAVQTEKGTTMQVYVNGKLYNKQPGKFLRVRSTPGLFHLEVKVLNPWNKQWYIVRKDIRVEKGYEFQYKVVFVNRGKPELKEVKKYPMYSKYFLNTNLYNKHPIA
jgi:hypothetical protein